MKKVIQFNKFFVPAVIISSVLIIAGIVGLLTVGINFGLDFEPGMIENVRVVPTAIELTYSGNANIAVETSAQKVDFVISGSGAENETKSFGYITYETVGDMVAAMNQVDGVTAKAVAPAATKAADFFGSSDKNTVLSSETYRLYYAPENADIVSIEDVRSLFETLDGCSVKQSGAASENTFQIRTKDDGVENEASKLMQEEVLSRFTAKYGEENIAVIKTDFVGSKFSSSLATKSVFLVLATLVLIFLYATIRFHWDFALGSVIALLHDSLIMIAFIVATGMEFDSLTLAAILTIVGYSINATVVIFDRVRENIRNGAAKKFVDIINISLSDTLSRTVITTVTTLLAAIALYIFTSDSMKNFAMLLIVGLVSGAYSSMFISGAFVSACRKNWKPSDETKAEAQ